jgi:hypothetical protein
MILIFFRMKNKKSVHFGKLQFSWEIPSSLPDCGTFKKTKTRELPYPQAKDPRRRNTGAFVTNPPRQRALSPRI